MNYFKDADVPPPDTLNCEMGEDEMRKTRRSDDSPYVCPTVVRIRNIRGEEEQYSVAKHGFKIAHLETEMRNWEDLEERKEFFFCRSSGIA